MKKTIARNDRMTLGTDQKGLKPLPAVTLGRLMPVLGLSAVLGPLAVQAQGTAAPAAVAVSAPTASSVTPTSATPTAATTPKWGEGVMESEFLIKLRMFLETDPFDFKAFEGAFGVGFKADPPDGPHPDRSWGMDETRRVLPFGQTFNNRSRGGVRWSFDPGRNSAYLSMEFVKMPHAGKRDGDGLPCITQDDFMEAFDSPRWTRGHAVLRYSDGWPVYGAPLFTATSDTGVALRFSLRVLGQCLPDLYINFDRLPPHPGAARLTP